MPTDIESAATAIAARLVQHDAEPASSFPRDRSATDRAGFYSWWSDEPGLQTLSETLGADLPSLLYVGHAGLLASDTRQNETLYSRLNGTELHGDTRSSDFRRSLSAILRVSFSLHLIEGETYITTGYLDARGNNVVSDWIRSHLCLSTVPVSARDSTIEYRHTLVESVLSKVNAPLNWKGMPTTPVRETLFMLRGALTNIS